MVVKVLKIINGAFATDERFAAEVRTVQIYCMIALFLNSYRIAVPNIYFD